jgi:hypothetical protein
MAFDFRSFPVLVNVLIDADWRTGHDLPFGTVASHTRRQHEKGSEDV